VLYFRQNFLKVAFQLSHPEGSMRFCRNVAFAVGVCALCALCLVAFATPAYAYTDPNAVGLASQIITPLLIMLSAAATFMRKQIAAAFFSLRERLRRRADA
jgi:hypothetical protein